MLKFCAYVILLFSILSYTGMCGDEPKSNDYTQQKWHEEIIEKIIEYKNGDEKAFDWLLQLPQEADIVIVDDLINNDNEMLDELFYHLLTMRSRISSQYNEDVVNHIMKILKNDVPIRKRKILICLLGDCAPYNDNKTKEYIDKLRKGDKSLNLLTLCSLIKIGFEKEYFDEFVSSFLAKNKWDYAEYVYVVSFMRYFCIRNDKIISKIKYLAKTDNDFAEISYETLAILRSLDTDELIRMVKADGIKDKEKIIRKAPFIHMSAAQLKQTTKIFNRENNPKIKLEIAGILWKNNIQEGKDYVIAQLKEGKDFMLYRALEIAGKSRDMSVLPDIINVFERKIYSYKYVHIALTNLTFDPCYEQPLAEVRNYWTLFLANYKENPFSWNQALKSRVDFLVTELTTREPNSLLMSELRLICGYDLKINDNDEDNKKELQKLAAWWKENANKDRKTWIKNNILLACDDLCSDDIVVRRNAGIIVFTFVPLLEYKYYLRKPISDENRRKIAEHLKKWINDNPDMLELDNTWHYWFLFPNLVNPDFKSDICS